MNTLKKALLISLTGFIGFSFAYKKNKTGADKPSLHVLKLDENLSEITSKMKAGAEFVDVFFKITDEKKAGTTTTYTAKGLYKGKIVGLQFEVNSQIGSATKPKKGKAAKQSGPTKNGVLLHSLGVPSDAFLSAMSELYKIPTRKGFTTSPVSCAASLFGPAKSKSAHKYKLFFESVKDKWDIELFFSIDSKEKFIFLTEVNPGFRKSLMNAWSVK